ncbi:MAG: lipopolysaccharide kinase InaA family protein [Pseudomonadota bacterium]
MTFSSSYVDPVSIRKKIGPGKELLIINEKYQQFLKSIGFTTFDAAWAFAGGEIIKQKEDRTVIRAQFPCPIPDKSDHDQRSDEIIVFYIKKHSQRFSLWQRLLGTLRPSSPHGEGLKEFYNYCRFRQHTLGTAVPVAAGIKFSSFLQADSFLMTRDFFPLIALEEIVLQHPETLQGVENQTKKKNILGSIARFARHMHDSGMNQKDFNATHILLQELKAERPQVALFDLQRVDHNTLNRFRWPIKALAELNYTLPPAVFDENDRIFLFSTYKGKEKLSVLDHLQYRLIKQKTDRIAKHSKKRELAPKMQETD